MKNTSQCTTTWKSKICSWPFNHLTILHHSNKRKVIITIIRFPDSACKFYETSISTESGENAFVVENTLDDTEVRSDINKLH